MIPFMCGSMRMCKKTRPEVRILVEKEKLLFAFSTSCMVASQLIGCAQPLLSTL